MGKRVEQSRQLGGRSPRWSLGVSTPNGSVRPGLAVGLALLLIGALVVIASWTPARATQTVMHSAVASHGSTRHLVRRFTPPDAAPSSGSGGAGLQSSTTGASTWEEEAVPGTTNWLSSAPSKRSLGVDSGGNAYILWEYDGGGIDDPDPEVADVRFAARYADGTWEVTAPDVRNQSCGNCHSDNPNPVPVALAVDRAGNAHALWLDNPGGYNSDYSLPFYSFRSAGGDWGTPSAIWACNDLSECGSEATAPDIALDPAGNVYALSVRRTGDTTGDGSPDWHVFFSYRPSGGSWSVPVRVSSQPVESREYRQGGGYLSIAADTAGNAYALWSNTSVVNYSNGESFWFAYRPAGGAWTAPTPVSDGLAEGYACRPAIAADGAGNAYAVWTLVETSDCWTGEARFAHRPAGASWGTGGPLAVEADVLRQAFPAIAADKVGRAYAIWTALRKSGGSWIWDLHFAMREADGTWGTPETVNADPRTEVSYDPLSIAVDAAGKAYVLWRSTSGTFHLAWQKAPEIQGRAYTPGSGLPLIGVPVRLIRDGKILRETTTHAPDGRYVLTNVPITDSVVISVTLEHAARVPSTFRVMYGQAAGPLAYVATQPFTITAVANPLPRDINFSDNPEVTTDPGINRVHLDDLGRIYYHTHQAWQLADRLGQALNFQLPVDIIAYSARNGAFWEGPTTSGASIGVDPYVNLGVAVSDIADGNRPDNREWHEFGHHVMADTLNNLFPDNPADVNHNGYTNPSTTDSWTEGFAEFHSMMVSREIAATPRPELYRWFGWEDNLESNYLAWTTHANPPDPHPNAVQNEELAVAGLLLDLVDPIDADDATELASTLGVTLTYADCIEVKLADLWADLKVDYTGVVTSSAVAQGQGFGYLFDVKHLYDVLKYRRIGTADSRGNGLSDLDELFIAHGFFTDVNPQNHGFDVGEAAGQASDAARPNRRARPPLTGSYIAFQAEDAETGAPIDVQDFTVEVRFAWPYEHYGYSFQANSAQTPGRLFFHGPDPQYEATTYITAWGPGARSVSTEPLVVTNASYWEQMASAPTDFFQEHTFEMEKPLTAYLPAVLSGSSGQLAQGATSSASTRTQARTGRACVPGGEPPTKTPTVTVTPTPSR